MNRRQKAEGKPNINAKRVLRIMQANQLTLERHTGRRLGRTHDGIVIALRSNVRWCSDHFELACRNGEIVRVLFAIDACDREIIAWSATTAGISGEMVRDLMVACVERRFGISKAPQAVEWLSDNGSAYIAKNTLDTATALGLNLCFTPVRSPESNGIAEAFVSNRRLGGQLPPSSVFLHMRVSASRSRAVEEVIPARRRSESCRLCVYRNGRRDGRR